MVKLLIAVAWLVVLATLAFHFRKVIRFDEMLDDFVAEARAFGCGFCDVFRSLWLVEDVIQHGKVGPYLSGAGTAMLLLIILAVTMICGSLAIFFA